jgi:hypothetical protein
MLDSRWASRKATGLVSGRHLVAERRLRVGTEHQELSPSSTFRLRDANVVLEAFPDETVAANLGTGRYYSIDLIGAETLALLTSGHALHAVAVHLAERFGADLPVVEDAVIEFAGRLLDEELIGARPPGDPGNPGDPLPPAERASTAFSPPSMSVYSDMEDLLLLDPIHDVDETGWPARPGDVAPPPAPHDGG